VNDSHFVLHRAYTRWAHWAKFGWHDPAHTRGLRSSREEPVLRFEPTTHYRDNADDVVHSFEQTCELRFRRGVDVRDADLDAGRISGERGERGDPRVFGVPGDDGNALHRRIRGKKK
jgi:hypothetical protein